MPGICAGVQGKTAFGDIILADTSWNWQSGKHSVDELGAHFAASPHPLDIPEFVRARGHALRNDRDFLSKIKQGFQGERAAEELNLRVGPVASGSAVLADEGVVKQIQVHDRGLVGVEMEIYGMYAAAAYASYPRPTAFAMKSVCDFGTKVKDDKYQTYAAYTSAQVVKEYLERYLFELHPLAGT
ncbi:hypothetical protein AWV79_27265 [Cupriavidus sp. UYMMa02A]|nr:hypothetical protein AWV79_27265 [Cupriavidus sp. UYMMa02A]